MKDKLWKEFEETGNINAYLGYKTHTNIDKTEIEMSEEITGQ